MKVSYQKDEVDLLIDEWGGNVKSLISQLLEERQPLIKQIKISTNAISTGYTRGWKPDVPEN